jgi:hypothetical protein
MADFSTILNPNNTTLNLYCNSIKTNNIIPLNAYLYANGSPPTVLSTTDPSPVLLIDVNSNDINISNGFSVDFINEGTYSFIASINAVNDVDGSDPSTNPPPFLQIKLIQYDSSSNIKHVSNVAGQIVQGNSGIIIPFVEYPINLSVNAIFTIVSGDFIRLVATVIPVSGAPTPNFAVSITQTNLNVIKI